MAHLSPLNNRHEAAEASFLDFGAGDGSGPSARVVETFGEIEAEYAAIRKGVALLDLPQRATIRVTGSERIDFLNRMLTQELRPGGSPLPPGSAISSFWLNRKGRIDADLRLIELGDSELTTDGVPVSGMYFDTDILSAPNLVSTLEAFVFSEDIAFEDITAKTHRLALHGPAAARLLADHSQPLRDDLPAIADIQPNQATAISVNGCPVVANRHDQTGEIGIELIVATKDLVTVFDHLAQHARTDHGHHNDPATDRYRLRHAGWHAFNIARIEAGTPLFQIDFGSSNLPHESSLLDSRVNFKKGCYLGQEVVARMQSLGHPKQLLRCIRIARETAPDDEKDQPVTGCAVAPSGDNALAPPAEFKPIGGVTSSCRSPMLGDDVLCLAMIKWGHHEAGTKLLVQTPTGWVQGEVQPQLAAWSKR
ncbi:MAG: YgfZ/GcvT domain-containing protein [Phycisphaerales bacterium JB065]